jgi:hypothetical protein
MREDASGNLWAYDKNDVGAKPVLVRGDPAKAAQAAATLARSVGEETRSAGAFQSEQDKRVQDLRLDAEKGQREEGFFPLERQKREEEIRLNREKGVREELAAPGTRAATAATTGKTLEDTRLDRERGVKLSREELAAPGARAATAAATGRTIEETAKLREDAIRNEFVARNVPAIARQYETTPQHIEQMRNAGTLDKYMEGHDRESDSYRKWQELRRQEVLEGKPTTPYSDFMWSTSFAESPTGGPGGEIFKRLTMPQLEEGQKQVNTASALLPTLNQRLNLIETRQMATGPIAGSEWFQNAATWAKQVHPDMDISGVTNAQQMAAAMETLAAQRLKEYGRPTDMDAIRAMRQFGSGTQDPEALSKITRWMIRDSVRSGLQQRDRIDEALKQPGVTRDPMARDALMLQRQQVDRQLGDQTASIFDDKGEALSTIHDIMRDKDLTPQDRASLLKTFDAQWGNGMAAYVLQNRPDWLPR